MDSLLVDKLKRFSTIDFMNMKLETLFTNRRDIKYIISIDRLDAILEKLVDHYDLLVRAEKGYAQYHTGYFDTDEFSLYQDHHRGKGNRSKIRVRTYEDGASYLEVKQKSNTGLTLKRRLPIDRRGFQLSDYSSFIEASMGPSGMDYSEKLEVTYQRITFFSKQKIEKITLDFGLTYTLGNVLFPLHGLLIGESKGVGQAHSFFNNYMRSLRVHTSSFSKYCFGVANLEATVKSNNFKPLLRRVKKIEQSNAISSILS